MRVQNIQNIFREWYIYIIVVVMWIVVSLVTSHFRQMSTFMNILILSIPLSIVALGQNLVILTGKFDLSVGAILALSTVIASEAMKKNIALGIFLPIIVGLFIGFINGIGVSILKIDSFIMTFGMMPVCMGIGLLIREYPGGYISPSYIKFLTYRVGPILLTPLIIFLIVLLFGEFILRRTNFGRNIYAVGNNEINAYMSGINVTLIKILVFTISGFTASLGGLFLCSTIACGDVTIGDSYTFDSITAVVIGGTILSGGRGDFKGTIGAVLILSSLGRIFNMTGVDIWWTYVIKGLLLFVVVVTRSMLVERKEVIL